MEFTDRLMQRMREEKIEFRRGSAGGGESTSAAVPERKARGSLQKLSQCGSCPFSWVLHWQFPSLEPQMVQGTLPNPQLGGMMSQLWKIRSSTTLLERPPWFDVLVEEVELPGGKVVSDYHQIQMPHYTAVFAVTVSNRSW